MNQNENNPRNTAGYPQQNNFIQGGYPGAYFGQQGGMQNYPTGSPQAAAGQNPGFQPGMPGYHPQQTAEQTGYPRYFAQQNTPNATTVTGYPPAGNNYGGQAGYPPAGNSYSGQTGYMAGYPASQGTAYQTNPRRELPATAEALFHRRRTVPDIPARDMNRRFRTTGTRTDTMHTDRWAVNRKTRFRRNPTAARCR